MGTGRDDFSKDTIRRAAGRVGYRCSFPGCPNSTIGASLEDSSKVSTTGVAAHICAAARGGPRYDEKMTVDERRSVDNCIWLCQTHSKLIDTDEKTYPVELLRQWKRTAENAASQALANGDYFVEHYNSNGNNLFVLGQLFDDMVVDGQFEQLKTLLGQYRTTLSDQYEEFVLRYKIIYDVYCSRRELPGHLNAYCALPCKAGADKLALLFLSFRMEDELKIVEEYCIDQTIKEYVSMSNNNTLIGQLLVPVGSGMTMSFPAEIGNAIGKYITNYIRENNITGAIDSAGNEYTLFSDEFYYRAVSSAYGLSRMTIFGSDDYDKIQRSPDFEFIRDNLTKVKNLDISLQEYIWVKFLLFLSMGGEEFQAYYTLCPAEVKSLYSVQKIEYLYRINNDIGSINADDMLEFAGKSGDTTTLCMYLSNLSKDDANSFLAEHAYLYKKSCKYLELKLNLSPEMSHDEAYALLEKYKDVYADDFLFHCLLARHSSLRQQNKEIIDWLQAHRSECTTDTIFEYIKVLWMNELWDDLAELSTRLLPNECAFNVAGYLSESRDDNYIRRSLEIYKNLLSKGWQRKWLNFNIGCIQRHLGYVEEAKNSFKSEYDQYHTDVALKNLICLRFETQEFTDDVYFEELKNYTDFHWQNWVGAICLKLGHYCDARKYFLRSLLINCNDNPSISGFWQTVGRLPEVKADTVQANTVCVLKDTQHLIQIAIHSPDIMEGIAAPCQFANCAHFSAEDGRIVNLLFHSVGDSVSLDGNIYEVDAILTVNETISKFFFFSMQTNKDAMLIQSSSPEELLQQIKSIVKSSYESLEKEIEDYNQQKIRYPLTYLAALVGKKSLITCEFLAFGNKKRIRNNLTSLEQTNSSVIYVLSYDAIVFLAHIGYNIDTQNGPNLLCAIQVRNQLLNDINEELSDLNNENTKGCMVCDGENVSIIEHSPEYKRERYTFLTKLKAFVITIPYCDIASDFKSANSKIKDSLEQLFSQRKLFCEGGSLSTARNTPNGILITDDQFLYAIASIEDIPNMGLTGFLANTTLGWKALLDMSKQLSIINFANYLPLQLYKQMVDQAIENKAEIEIASREIQKWLLSDTDSDATEKHEDVILALFHDVYSSNFHYLNPGDILGKNAIRIYEKRNPDFMREYISYILNPDMPSIE